MSTFKFACPSCGQHINCDVDQAGSHMECPTCFQNIVVPQAPQEGESKFVLTAAKVNTRVIPTDPNLVPLTPEKKKFPFVVLGLVVVLCAAVAAGVVFRHKLFKPPTKFTGDNEEVQKVVTPTVAPVVRPRSAPPTEPDANWTLGATNATIPEGEVMGRVSGFEFTNQKAMLTGGTLALRTGPDWPPEVGISVRFYAKKGEQLAGKTFLIGPDQKKGPEVVLRWLDEKRQPQSQKLTNGYAMRLEFGEAVNRELTGKIYLCTPDDYKSWVMGNFTARIRGPRPTDQPGDP